MSAFATTPATATIGDITSYLDQENLYNPLNVLKAEAAEVYGKMVKVIETQFSLFLLPGTESGQVPTSAEQLAYINAALASEEMVNTGTQRFVELKMIIQLYADLLHQIAEGTLSSSDQTIELITKYAKNLADLFDNIITNGINYIKRIKGYAPGNYRYLKKALFSADPVKNPDDLDLTELHDSVVPLVIFNVLNKIKNDSIFWDTGEYSPEDQILYLFECMNAVEIKQAIERRELPNAPIKYIADMTDRMHAKSREMTKEALQNPDGLKFIAKIEEIISEKRDELKSLDDNKNMDIERDDADDGADAALTIDDADLIQAHYYKPGEFFHNILIQIFASLGKGVPPNLIAIANELDKKIVKSVPNEDKDKVIPKTRYVKVGAHGVATSTREMESTHPFRGVNLRSVIARSFLKRVLRIEIFKSIPAHTQTKIPSEIERLSQRIKTKRFAILLDFEITEMQLDILIGWQREGLIKLMKVSKNFFSDIDLLFTNFKKHEDIDTLMLLFRKIQVAIKDVGFINPKTATEIKKEMKERVKKQKTGLDLDKKKLMNRIIRELTMYLDTFREKRREALHVSSSRLMNLAGTGKGGKRNTKKQKKNQKKKTMKAPHKRTIKKRKRRKNKTSKNRS